MIEPCQEFYYTAWLLIFLYLLIGLRFALRYDYSELDTRNNTEIVIFFLGIVIFTVPIIAVLFISHWVFVTYDWFTEKDSGEIEKDYCDTCTTKKVKE